MEYYCISHKKEQTIHSLYNLDDSQMHIAKWKKLYQEGLHNAWFCLYGILEKAKLQKRGKKDISGCQSLGLRGSGGDHKKLEGIFFWVTQLICILMVVICICQNWCNYTLQRINFSVCKLYLNKKNFNVPKEIQKGRKYKEMLQCCNMVNDFSPNLRVFHFSHLTHHLWNSAEVKS